MQRERERGGKAMKIRTEERDGDNEIVIYCRERSKRIRQIEYLLEQILSEDGELVLTLGDTEHYVPKKEILFFETMDGKIAAHTREKMLYTTGTLQGVEKSLPHSFVRASKSCIVNAAEVCALSKNFTGIGEVLFRRCEKKAFVSRSCYKDLKKKVYELHELEN